jgi:iron complex outermembrane receptor protein
VGGALILQSRQPRFSSRPELTGFLQGGYGSFSQLPLAGGLRLQTKRIDAGIRLLRQSAENDFITRDQYGVAFRTAHARMKGGGGMAELAYRLTSRDVLRAYIWLQDYRREIPRALFEQFSDKVQDERSHRFLLQYSHGGPRLQSYARLAWIDERFQYDMPSARISTDVRTDQYIGEAGAERGFGKWGRVLAFIPVQLARLESADTTAWQKRLGVAGAWRHAWLAGRVQAALNLRAEQIDGDAFVLPGVGGSWQAGGHFTLKLSAQRSYRAPTLNERYYVPGGNRNLKPEQGWSVEAGYSFDHKEATGLELHHELTLYGRLIDNWILWLGGAIWTPHNIAQVFSRGAETNNTLTFRAGPFCIRTGAGLAWTMASPTRSILPNDNSIGKQLPYTPRWTGNLRLGVSWKALDLSYLHAFGGRRFTTSDESSWLEAYHTADLIGSVSLGRRPGLQLQMSLRNLYNAQYAVVASRPMPGRSILAGIRLGFE